MRLIDSHSHLFLEEFAEDLPQVMARAREAGVTHIFMPNIDSTTIGPMLRVCREYKGYCYPMIGLHPTSVGADYEKELEIVLGSWLHRMNLLRLARLVWTCIGIRLFLESSKGCWTSRLSGLWNTVCR